MYLRSFGCACPCADHVRGCRCRKPSDWSHIAIAFAVADRDLNEARLASLGAIYGDFVVGVLASTDTPVLRDEDGWFVRMFILSEQA